ncbi:unnamed protein product [Wuchereria bancrofti]|uniref:Uncharacterized protein n=1 Tax=Wuchereria bancrofti TaxID=6293 RepID=A0A3P7ETB7_WUCBA|nr:unnamed protein product [Wuchereria bancrofti]
MKNEVRTTVIVSVVLVGVLAVSGIIGCMIIKRRRKGMEGIEAIQEREALQKYLETGVEIDQETMDVNMDPRMRQKLMSTRSRHRKERSSLPLNSRRLRFSKFQSSGQQSSNINVNDEVEIFHTKLIMPTVSTTPYTDNLTCRFVNSLLRIKSFQISALF